MIEKWYDGFFKIGKVIWFQYIYLKVQTYQYYQHTKWETNLKNVDNG